MHLNTNPISYPVRLLPILKQNIILACLRLLALSGRVLCRKKVNSDQVRHIAILHFGGVGDMVIGTPVIRALGNHFPDAEITVICSDRSSGHFLLRFPNVIEIRGFDIYGLDVRTLMRKDCRTSFVEMATYLFQRRFDLLINLHVPAFIEWLAAELLLVAISQAKLTIGFDSEFLVSGGFYDFSLSAQEQQDLHYTEMFAALLGRAGLNIEPTTEYPVSDIDRSAAKQILSANAANSERPLVCLHPGGKRLALESKLWPASFFGRLAATLIQQGYAVALVGVHGEETLAESICAGVKGCLNLVGKTTLDQMAALVAEASLFIGNDSGPFHIAVAVGTRALGICGRPDAEPEYYKYGKPGVAVLVKPSPELITVEDVLSEAWRLVGRRQE